MACAPLAQADDKEKPAALPPAPAPAGTLVPDAVTGQPAVGSLPVDFVRSPDHDGPGGLGRYLVAINSGYGLQFEAKGNCGQESLALIDLNARPAPQVIQNVYFLTPQSACVGAAFQSYIVDGVDTLYVSGGFENKVWCFDFKIGASQPISPGSPGPNAKVSARFVDLAPQAALPANPRYNSGKPAVYPLGLVSQGLHLFTANNLDDSVGVSQMDDGGNWLQARVNLRSQPDENVFPYAAAALSIQQTKWPGASKVYVSLWNAASVATFEWPPQGKQTGNNDIPVPPVTRIPTGSHPSALLMDAPRHRLYVANANDDSVSVIDTDADKEVERVSVRLTDAALPGVSPEALALSADGGTLYVANARADCVAVVRLGDKVRGQTPPEGKDPAPSRLAGLIPTGRYPSALALVGDTLFVGNGKGTGTENSSNIVNDSGLNPNAPNADFPPTGRGNHEGRGGAYSVATVSGNYAMIPVPDEAKLADFTATVLRRNGLTVEPKAALFAGRAGGSPIRHVIYIIKENRTYDQVFGDVAASGDGTPADGDPALAIFGAGDAARRPGGPAQDVTPNHRALAQRFGLLDRFFVNSEASADGHNWSTAAFSTDYVDKVFRWNYSGRGRFYDFEGFNRLPSTGYAKGTPSLLGPDATPEMLADFLRRHLPYTHGGTDVGEPATRYLWDLAATHGMSYRAYGEFIATASADELAAARANRPRRYPDLSPNVVAVPAKPALEGHFCPAARNFDLNTPDALTVDAYRIALTQTGVDSLDGGNPARVDPLVSPFNPDARFRGVSRIGSFLEEFARSKGEREAGEGDSLPALSIVRLSNDHTAGLAPGKPSPQFYVADNDYALGRLVEAVSRSEYWVDTAIVAVEDDAQDGPDHVDCHRSAALVVSAYNRPGALVHTLHTTAGVVRTIELLLGLPPMNAQDAAAAPVDVFRDGPPDLTPYAAVLPTLDLAALVTPRPEAAPDAETAAAIRQSGDIDLAHADAGDPSALNAAVWLSVRGPGQPMPGAKHWPAYGLLRGGADAGDEDGEKD